MKTKKQVPTLILDCLVRFNFYKLVDRVVKMFSNKSYEVLFISYRY